MGWFMCLCLLIFFLHSQFHFSSSSSSNSSSPQLCRHDQSVALLEFKNTFSFDSDASSAYCDKPYPKMKSWKEGTDCCSWDGVTCDWVTGHVIGLNLSCSWLNGTIHSNSSLFLLSHLQWLDLDDNDFYASPISPKFGRFVSLTHLNLSYSIFSGLIPSEISHLSKLVSLDLSWNEGCQLETQSLKRLVQNLTELRELSLNKVNMSLVELGSLINLSSSLTSLNLGESRLRGKFPDNIFCLPNLQMLRLNGNPDLSGYFRNINSSSSLKILDLSYTSFSREILHSIGHLRSLNYLVLSGLDFSGEISNSISNLKSLNYLDLSYTSLSGEVLNSIGNLKSLNYLDLSTTNLSGKVLNSIGNLKSLNYLHLSGTNFSGEVPNSIGNLKSLKYLDLSAAIFSGKVPDSIGNLKSLKYLDLSAAIFSGKVPDSIGNLKSLKYLDLSAAIFSGKVPDSIGNLKSLNHLVISGTNFSGKVLNSISNLKSLNYLDLSSCEFSGSIPASLGNLTQITHLDLSSNHFTGEIPSSLCKLGQLTHLDLSDNNFSLIQFSIVNMTRLARMDLSYNQLAGPIPSQVLPNSQLADSIPSQVLPYLENLDLSYNSLNGTIPFWVFIAPSLLHLDLSHNHLTGFDHLTDQFHEFQYTSLLGIYLHDNELQGPIPRSVFQLVNLTFLSLSSNNLSGMVEADKFVKLKNLVELDLSNNNLSWSTNNINFTLPNFTSLTLSSCNLSQFPNFLIALENLEFLDLSNNKIHSDFPNWVWDTGKDSLYYLNLSSNLLTGVVQFPWKNLDSIDLHSNLLQGPLPIPPPSTRFFLISNNNLSGRIPSLICNASLLQLLDLSNNCLSGKIPQCLGNFSNDLSVLDLRMNSFYGTIPIVFAKGNNSLRNLDLNGNQLEGPVPESLINCRKLEVLDLGNNMIHDTFPNWLDTLPELQVLVLRSNRFHGPTTSSKTRFPFPKLRIIDLSHNEFTGLLPTKYFKNLTAMMNMDYQKTELTYMGESYYQGSVTVTMKGFEYKLVKILTTLTAIDLSNNKFEGEIPICIGNLNSLRILNLSQNSLIGHIPPSLGNLMLLESLDLSSNKLDGGIPSQLTNLTFLEVLNLSQNHLTGTIPRGKQFDTFENNSYNENLGLCGLPLSKKCGHDEALGLPPSIEKEEDSEFAGGFRWKAVSMGYGCGTIFGLIMGFLIFSIGKPEWFVRLVEGGQHKKGKRWNKSAHRRGGRRN